MPRFDEWVTDPAVTLAAVRAFVENPALVGEKFLGRYTVTTTSGTTGTPGIFLADQQALTVTTALSARMLGSWLTATNVTRVAARGGRVAMVIATGSHFAAATAAAALRKNRLRRKRIGSSARTPQYPNRSKRSMPSARPSSPRTPAWARCWLPNSRPGACASTRPWWSYPLRASRRASTTGSLPPAAVSLPAIASMSAWEA
jgi:hypothetical protein